MAEFHEDKQQVNARIVYWGVPGAGITSNLQSIHAKLKANNRGDLRRIATRIDPTVEYEVLPIELGKVNGIHTRLHVIGVPGAPEQAPTRKQLLDRIDGIVFVVDSRIDRLAENLDSLQELREALAAYGHDLAAIPLVVQYNKCDLVDDIAIERLHREIDVAKSASFEAAANSGTGVLKTLTTISKQVIRTLGRREPSPAIASSPEPQAARVQTPTPQTPAPKPAAPVPPEPAPPATRAHEQPTPTPAATPTAETVPAPPAVPHSNAELMEAAILLEGEGQTESQVAGATANEARSLLDQTWETLSSQNKPEPGARIGADLQIVSVGSAERIGGRGIRLPLVLGNAEGESVTLALTIALDPLLDDEQ